MIMVFVVACVWLLLEVGPAADVLQALRGVPDLNQARRLQGWRNGKGVSVLWGHWGLSRQAPATGDMVQVAQWPLPSLLRTCFLPDSILGSLVSFHSKSLCTVLR